MTAAIKLVDVPKHLRRPELKRRLPQGKRFRDLTGQKLSRASVIGLAGFFGVQSAWLCRCKCGQLFVTRGATLIHRDAGCGCTYRSQGGESKTNEYETWRRLWRVHPQAMSKRWREYSQFLTDVGRRPKKGYSLQRLNRNRPFGPGNVQWLSPAEANRSILNKLIRHGGKSLSITGWAKEVGITTQAMQQRVAQCKQRGVNVRHAITTPPGERLPRK